MGVHMGEKDWFNAVEAADWTTLLTCGPMSSDHVAAKKIAAVVAKLLWHARHPRSGGGGGEGASARQTTDGR